MRPLNAPPLRWLAVVFLPVLAGLSFGLATASPARQAPSCAWVRLASGEDRTQGTLVEQPDGVLAFGGADVRQAGSSVKDDVHRLNLSAGAPGTWAELGPTGQGPGKRAEHASIAAGAQRMITYGGIDEVPTGGGGGTFTWQSALLGGGAPPSLLGAYVPETVQNTSFQLDLAGGAAAWSRFGPLGQARTDHSAIYDPDGDAMIVFGGRQDEEATSADNGTWRLGLGADPAWQRLQGTGAPSRRFAHTAVYDSAGKRMIVFGGTSDWKTGMNDVFALDLSGGWEQAAWSKLTPSGTAPRGRFDHGAVYLPAQNWMVIFGGTPNGSSELSDVFALDLGASTPAWINPRPSGNAPPAIAGLSAAYSPAGGYAVFYGGAVKGDAKDQAWALSCTSSQPTATATSPTASDTPAPTEPGPGDTATPTTAAPSYTPVTPEPGDLVVSLDEQNASGISGRVIMHPAENSLMVTIEVTGSPAGASHPAHIHSGRCPTPGGVTSPLASVVDGLSVTKLEGVTLASVADGNHAVNLHRSAEDISTYIACGDIPLLSVATATPTPTPVPTQSTDQKRKIYLPRLDLNLDTRPGPG